MATKSEVLCQHFVLQIELVLLGHGLLEQLPNVQRIKVTSNVVGCLSMCVCLCVCVLAKSLAAYCLTNWPFASIFGQHLQIKRVSTLSVSRFRFSINHSSLGSSGVYLMLIMPIILKHYFIVFNF